MDQAGYEAVRRILLPIQQWQNLADKEAEAHEANSS
jgi:hypothetical protein